MSAITRILFSVHLFTAIFLLVSCKKEEPAKPEPITELPAYDNYSQLKPGNYWIYQRYTIDSAGNSIPLNIFDSCYVEKDTIIHNNTYYKYTSPDHVSPSASYSVFLRDSLHYTVDDHGQVIFSSQDFITVFDEHYYIQTDTLYHCIFKMAGMDTTATTPAGSYTALNAKKVFDLYFPYYPAGSKRIENCCYSKGIGKVSETLHTFFTAPITERRLYKYHLE